MDLTENMLRIEATVIGTLLRDSTKLGEVAAILSPSDFSEGFTRQLYSAICDMHFAGEPVNRVTVEHKLGSEWAEAIAEVLRYTTPELLYYAEMCKEQSKLHKLRDEAATLAGAETLDAAAESIDALNALMLTRRSAEIVSAQAAASAFIRDTEPGVYLPWGMEQIDRCVDAELGDFIAIGGYPSAGKTLLSLQFALEMSKTYRVGYFSLETGTRKLVSRIMSHLSQVPLKEIKHKDKLTPEQWKALTEASAKLYDRQFDIIDAAAMSVRDIQAVTLNKRYQVIFIDYLQIINGPGANRYEKVTNISQALHTLARANGVTVIALAQLSRPEKSNGKPQPPSMSSFRESGQIEQDVDIAFLLWPSDPNDNNSERVFKIAKNKENERAKFSMDFNGATQTLTPHKETRGEAYRRINREISKASKQHPDQINFEAYDGKEELPF